MAEKFAGEDLLNKILEKSPDSITDDERDVLRARISYLTKEQIEKYGLDEKKEEEIKIPPMAGDVEGRGTELKKMKDKELKVLAKELEIDVKGMKKPEIIENILAVEEEKKLEEEKKEK